MNEIVQLLIEHHIPWFVLAWLVVLVWPLARRWWEGRNRAAPKTLPVLREQLSEVERRQAALNEQIQELRGNTK